MKKMIMILGLILVTILSGCQEGTGTKRDIGNTIVLNDERFRDGLNIEGKTSAEKNKMISKELDDIFSVYRGKDPRNEPFDFALKPGKEKYEKYCVSCHGIKGDGKDSEIKYSEGKFIDLTATDMQKLDERYIWTIIAFGSKAGLMPGFNDKLIIDDFALISAYICTLNKSGSCAPVAKNIVDAFKKNNNIVDSPVSSNDGISSQDPESTDNTDSLENEDDSTKDGQ